MIYPEMKIYIAGPMSGLEGENRHAFNKAASPPSNHIVLNPAILPDGLTQAEYMSLCLPMVMMCDAVLMLEGWERSQGATAEHALAEKLGKYISYQVTPVCPYCRPADKVPA